jgi:hypothetical protein
MDIGGTHGQPVIFAGKRFATPAEHASRPGLAAVSPYSSSLVSCDDLIALVIMSILFMFIIIARCLAGPAIASPIRTRGGSRGGPSRSMERSDRDS